MERVNILKAKISYKDFLKVYGNIVSVLAGIESFILIFIEIPDNKKYCAAIINICVFILILIVWYIIASNLTEKKISISGTQLTIKFGDLFTENGNKVISCNEYFDSIVDEKLISSKTLHGQVINKYIKDIDDFDNKILSDMGCNASILSQNKKKTLGKTTRYKLGTCFKYGEFIFVAFSKFDDQYRAHLDLPNYLYCLANFWGELNRVYNGEDVIIPLLGSGITRFDNNRITKQEQLSLLVDSLRYSNLSFTHDAKITIILPESLKNEIKLFNVN